MSANEYLRRAVELARDGDLEAALAEVKQALRVEPGHEKGLIFRFTLEARLLRRERRFGDAAVRYHAVLALDAENREARQMLREHAEGARLSAVDSGRPATVDSARSAATQHDKSARAAGANELPAQRADPAIDASAARAAGERASNRPTMPPPTAGAYESAESESRSSQGAPARNLSSAPPMVEVVTMRKERRTGPIKLTLQATTVESRLPRSLPPDSEPPIVTLAGSTEADDNNGDFMAEDLPPPSVETPLEQERRIARRVAIEVNVGVSSESNFFTGFSGDISEGGLFIATYNLVPIGSHVRVSFGVMGREIDCDATVCWLRDPIDINLMPGFGVRFGELSDDDHAAILKFINTRTPMFYDDD